MVLQKILFRSIFAGALCAALAFPFPALGEGASQGFAVNLSEQFNATSMRIHVLGDGGRLIGGSRRVDGANEAFIWSYHNSLQSFYRAENKGIGIRNADDKGLVVAGMHSESEVGWYWNRKTEQGAALGYDFWRERGAGSVYSGLFNHNLQVSADGKRIAGSIDRGMDAFVLNVDDGTVKPLPGTRYSVVGEPGEDENDEFNRPDLFQPGGVDVVWPDGKKNGGNLLGMSRDGKRFLIVREADLHHGTYVMDETGEYKYSLKLFGKGPTEYLEKGTRLGKFKLKSSAYIKSLQAYELSYDGRYAVGKVTLQYSGPMVGAYPLSDTMDFPVRWDFEGDPLFLSDEPYEFSNGEISDDGKVVAILDHTGGYSFRVWREGEEGLQRLDQLMKRHNITIEESSWDLFLPRLSYDGKCVSTVFMEKETDIYKDPLTHWLICFEGENPFLEP